MSAAYNVLKLAPMDQTTSATAANASPGSSTAGLRDVVALASSVTSIENGVLSYRGINIDELAENATFEEVIHLLWHGNLPSREELATLRTQIATHAALPQGLIEVMPLYPEPLVISRHHPGHRCISSLEDLRIPGDHPPTQASPHRN